MNWFRVELDKSGAILRCEQVEAKEAGGRFVRFIEATTKAEACSAAKAWHEAHKAKDRARQAAVRRAKAARKECRQCTQKAEKGRRYCKDHRGGQSTHRGGMQVSLQMVLRKFDMYSPKDFRAWLVSEIGRRSIGAPASVGQTAGDGV